MGDVPDAPDRVVDCGPAIRERDSNAAAVGPESTDSAAMLELEKALFLAATHKPEAEAALRSFIRTYPKHPRFAEACIDLKMTQSGITYPRTKLNYADFTNKL